MPERWLPCINFSSVVVLEPRIISSSLNLGCITGHSTILAQVLILSTALPPKVILQWVWLNLSAAWFAGKVPLM